MESKGNQEEIFHAKYPVFTIPMMQWIMKRDTRELNRQDEDFEDKEIEPNRKMMDLLQREIKQRTPEHDSMVVPNLNSLVLNQTLNSGLHNDLAE